MRTSKSKDLFDESTMSFGEHLEALRTHLWKAIVGLALSIMVCLLFSNRIVAVVRAPIDSALQRYGVKATDDVGESGFWEWLKDQFGADIFTGVESKVEDSVATKPDATLETHGSHQITVLVPREDFAKALNIYDPERFPERPGDIAGEPIPMRMASTQFAMMEQVRKRQNQPITLTVQEAFMTYIKVAVVSGFVLASPWVFYQLWLFVAAGLYPHERHYVYKYLPISLTLFIGGAAFCFIAVFPFVLKFLLGFNAWLEVAPQIRLSEWISFAIMLPVMFGLSFQLPVIMLFMERISIFDVDDYRTKRRMAILVIAVVSMLLTPSDPMSMTLMMFPLIGLYELGIFMCGFSPAAKSPFEAEAA